MSEVIVRAQLNEAVVVYISNPRLTLNGFAPYQDGRFANPIHKPTVVQQTMLESAPHPI